MRPSFSTLRSPLMYMLCISFNLVKSPRVLRFSGVWLTSIRWRSLECTESATCKPNQVFLCRKGIAVSPLLTSVMVIALTSSQFSPILSHFWMKVQTLQLTCSHSLGFLLRKSDVCMSLPALCLTSTLNVDSPDKNEDSFGDVE